MTFKKITKVAVFIDYDNFTITYSNHHKIDEANISIWDSFNEKIISEYQKSFIKNDFEVIEHTGTWLCIGVSDFPSNEEREIKEKFERLDRKHGFIVNYGTRLNSYRDKKTGEFKLGKEKGVDSEIICQMLMGAFQNHYDSCILVSDDGDYIPAVKRIQDFFGKKVIQAGFRNGRLRELAYAHIPFENTSKDLEFK